MADALDIGRDASDGRTQRRIALNQATLRRLHEAMRAPAGRRLAFRCECGQIGCNELIGLGAGEYAAVRAHPRHFAIVPGHEVDAIDDPVEHHETYVVVAARAPAALAEQTNPRTRHNCRGHLAGVLVRPRRFGCVWRPARGGRSRARFGGLSDGLGERLG